MMSIGLLRVPKPTRGQILPPTPVPNLHLPHLREQVEAAADQYQKSKEIYAKLAEQVVLGLAINAAGTSGCIRRFSNFISKRRIYGVPQKTFETTPNHKASRESVLRPVCY